MSERQIESSHFSQDVQELIRLYNEFVSLEDLVNAKRAAGRPKDLQDLIYLEPLLGKDT